MPTQSPEQTLRPTTAVGFGRRAAAYGIDIVLIAGLVRLFVLLGTGLISAALAWLGYELYFVKTVEYTYGLRLLDGLLTTCSYFILCEWLFGATVGKLILGMRVVKLNGQPCSLISALVRGVVRFIDGLVLGLPAYSSMSKNPELRQRLGDRAARTVVVHHRDPFIRRTRAPWRLPAALAAFVVLMQAWVVLFSLWSGQNSLGPRYLPVKVSAGSANLESADFSLALVLSEEYGTADFADFDGKDISERLFASEDAAVQSRVALFDSRLIGTREELSTWSEEALGIEFEGSRLTLEPPQEIRVGERGVLRRFVDEAAAREGYIILFRRSNVLVRLILYGPTGRFTVDQASSLAATIDTRLTSSDPAVR